MIIYTVIALSLLALATLQSVVGFVIGIIGLGLCFGGTMGVFPSIVMENYGPKTKESTTESFYWLFYGCLLCSKMAAQIAGQNGGDFTQAFYIAIALAAVGLCINIVYKLREKNNQLKNWRKNREEKRK